ncbi:MAG TPA: 50S ribosomal protein L33 [Candidatus Brocadiia bacterium]|nr:50S ribosomal protein L33 [Candidatus Brocadiia bacterium]
MREWVHLVCSDCSNQNYRISRDTRGTEKLSLKKYCRACRKHTVHKEKRK